ncbi:MAG: hypothetical protein J5J06_17555 [Phycisphaerae bacterium]|nr:hypothetical protein [Phycisphaerae bacterium]
MTAPVLHVISGCPGFQRTLTELAEDRAAELLLYADPDAFGAGHDAHVEPECLVLDVGDPSFESSRAAGRLPESLRNAPPLILAVPFCGGCCLLVADALRCGAELLAKPLNATALSDMVTRAWNVDRRRKTFRTKRDEIARRLGTLTHRERQVLDLVACGYPNKCIAAELELSQKTVEAHRSKVMHKMQARSLAKLIHMLYMLEPGSMDQELIIGSAEQPREAIPPLDMRRWAPANPLLVHAAAANS